MKLLETRSLCKKFQRKTANGTTGVTAVHDVSLTVHEGDFITITGKSGSGKTTLLTLLAGLSSPSSGAVLFKGVPFAEQSDQKLSRIRNREIGFIPQGIGLLGNLSVLDNVRAPQMFAGENRADSDRAHFLLETVGLGELAFEHPNNLSGGEMRRASIARALFNQPSILIADEPTSDLDPENTAMILQLLADIHRQGTAIIVVTHEQGVADCGRARFFMENGILSAPMLQNVAPQGAEPPGAVMEEVPQA